MSGARQAVDSGVSATPDTTVQGTHGDAGTPEPTFTEDFVDMFRHDPFAANQGEPQPPKATTTPSGAGGTVSPPATAPVAPAGTQTPAGGNPPAPTTQQPTPDANLQLMRDTAAAMAAATQNLQQPSQQQNPAAPPPDPTLDYLFEVPPPLAAALVHENPAVRVDAQRHMNAAIAKTVHMRMRDEMLNYAQTEIPKMVQGIISAHNYRESIQRDFYGTYKVLDNPAFKGLVSSVSGEVMNEMARTNPNLRWNDQIRDAVANRIFTLIPQLKQLHDAGKVAAPPQSTPPGNPAPRVPVQFTNGSRPAVPAASINTEQDIMNTLFG
jgi:hypothetical protein